MTRKQIEAAAEEAGWNVEFREKERGQYNRGKEYRKWYVCFTTDTACDQDVCHEFEVKTLAELPDKVYETWQNYDPEEEAVLWFKGRGAPGLRDLLNDMDEVDEKLEDLYKTLSGIHLVKEQKTFAEQAGALRHECLMELTSISHRAEPSTHGYFAKGFANPDKCSKYEEIIFLNTEWILLDGDGLQYDVNVMPLEDFCEMVDAIKKQTED